ncbi:MAG: hypothetical protein FJ100_14915, partial [Deltaproteobacteria bacterium]|nr:hypothetical protein [Deltaproteobacteria bacterium]
MLTGCALAATTWSCGDDPAPAGAGSPATADAQVSTDADIALDAAPPVDTDVDAPPEDATADAAQSVDVPQTVDAAPDLPAAPQCQAATDCPATGNPCVQPACTAAGQCATVSADGLGCDDGQPCTIAAYCKAGKCVAKLSAACECAADADCKTLEDGDLCNGTLYCDKLAFPFRCKVNPASVVTCDPASDTACSKSVCASKTGLCAPTPAEQAKQVCTAGKGCAWHAKEPGEVTATVACEDGNKCTTGDYCAGGQCQAGQDTCSCKSNADCADQDDGNLCNGKQFCNLATGQCLWNPATVVPCPSVDNTTCKKIACHPKTGQCIAVEAKEAKQACDKLPNGQAPCLWVVKAPGDPMPLVECDDGNPCTSNDTCVGGNCAAGTLVCECQSHADCAAKDDGDLCNGTWYCDKSGDKPACKPNPAGAVVCGDQPKSNCLKKACEPKSGQCLLAFANEGAACDDGDPCTVSEACAAGSCAGKPNPCDDGDLCTQDLCKAATGCGHAKANCDDGNACTLDLCNPKTGQCDLQPLAMDGKPCDADDNTCTPVDLCAAGTCKAGSPIVCKLAAGPCEVAVCVNAKPSFTCAVVAKPEGAPCADGDTCTIGAACSKGQCTPGSAERFYAKPVGPTGKHSVLSGVAPSEGGDVVVAGGTWSGSASQPADSAWWVARLDRLGKVVWQHETPLPAPHPSARAFAVAALADGGAVAAGGATTAQAGLNAQFARVDAKGTLLWSKDFGQAGADEVALAVA